MSLTPKLLKDCQLTLNHTNTKITIPQYGFGTASPKDQLEITKEAVKVAIRDAGIRHIDTARFYGAGKVEYMIGEALEELFNEKVVTREELFITTKVWPNYWDKAQESLDISLKALKVDYVDLFLQHWPLCLPRITNPKTGEFYGVPHDPKTGECLYEKDGDYITTYKQLDAIYNDPKNTQVRAIGVCNYAPSELQRLLDDESIKTKPSVVQVELNPQLNQLELVKFAAEHGMIITAYSPLGSTGAPILKLPEIKAVAETYGITAYDVVISWLLQKKYVVIPRSLNPERIAKIKNYYELPEEAIAKIDQIGIDNPYRHIDEDFASVLPGFTGRSKTPNE